jgi:HEPN domain-containing protein
VNRKELQALAEARLEDAQLLLKGRRFDGAYYLAGYAVECALKACIAKKTKLHDFPNKDLAQRVYTHDLKGLLVLADLKQKFEEESRNRHGFGVQWTNVKDWSEQSRYERFGRRRKASEMLKDVQGVLACIRKHW